MRNSVFCSVGCPRRGAAESFFLPFAAHAQGVASFALALHSLGDAGSFCSRSSKSRPEILNTKAAKVAMRQARSGSSEAERPAATEENWSGRLESRLRESLANCGEKLILFCDWARWRLYGQPRWHTASTATSGRYPMDAKGQFVLPGFARRFPLRQGCGGHDAGATDLRPLTSDI